MAPFHKFSEEKGKSNDEIIRVNPIKRHIYSRVRIIMYRDKDTRQIVMTIPSLDITGYGANEKKAEEMLKFSLDDFNNFLIKLSPKKISDELGKLGWKHSVIKNKEYSKAYVDMSGNLKNFNAVGDKVEEKLVTL